MPVTLAVAKEFINRFHRHHKKPQGHRFSLGLGVDAPGYLRGVATVGRPTSRHLDARGWYEVTRLCVLSSEHGMNLPGGCSMLYAACARRARQHAQQCAKGGFVARQAERVTALDPGPLAWRSSPVFIITYTLASESGASLRGAGWTEATLPADSSARRGRKADGAHSEGKPMLKCGLGPKRLWVFPLNGQARTTLKDAGDKPTLHKLYGESP